MIRKNSSYQDNYFSLGYNAVIHKSDSDQYALSDIPPESGIFNNIICVSEQFEKFWSLYPVKQSKEKARKIFQLLSPSQELFERMLKAVQLQCDYYRDMKSMWRWVPEWKYPANWLENKCWEDEFPEVFLMPDTTSSSKNVSAHEFFSESDRSEFECRNETEIKNNIADISDYF